ncbi:polymerase [Halteromyces radiatus]|uniref:polymerase n=1 Tax=Halteromyces radiatus TaxID=101107 RepID=UPI00221EDD91|nr:polymerase [Halteromyces radiatus]KAI8085123.1 polymerase [Halteromyces radiatus]
MLGVTPPLSDAPSSSHDIKLLDSLITVLKEQNAFELPEKTRLRESVLNILDELTKQLVYQISCDNGRSPTEASRVNSKVLTYGSYRLGVHAEDADIDTLCVLPRDITRDHFFERMYLALKEQSGVESLNAVEDAYVPVIKFKFHSIPIDLICTILPLSTIPEDLNVNNPFLLKHMDQRCIRSLNGTRVADELLSLVPDVDTFRLSLRCIKLWATKRAIYSNIIGFLGGVAWAILVARVCQLYPKACASTIVSKFFRIISNWNWPSPVLLKTVEEGSPLDKLKPWNPRLSMNDREHKMPIITPSFPSMCASHNVTQSTMKIIIGEMKLAADIVDKVMIGSTSWDQLFTENVFFRRYGHYIQVVVSSDIHESLIQGAGLVESRLRQLLTKLESSPYIALVHPFIDGIEDKRRCTNRKDVREFIGATKPRNSTDDLEPFEQTIYTKTFYIGLYTRTEISSTSPSVSIDLTMEMNSFKYGLQHHPSFDKEHTRINLRYLNRSNLPQELISTGSATMKRAYQETEIPDVTSSSSNINGKNSDHGNNNKKHRTLSNINDLSSSTLPDMNKTLPLPST